MRTLSLIHNGEQQTIELPANMAYAGLDELAINREGGVITLRPVRPSWRSLRDLPRADEDFLQERPDVIVDEGRFRL